MIRARLKNTLPGIALAVASPAIAAPLADHAAIDAQVTGFVMKATGDPSLATPVDRRLRLQACPSPLALGWFGKSRESVLVQCPVAGGWRLFVPLRARAGEGMAKDIARGDAVTIIVKGDNFRLSDRGVAMAAGTAGDWIDVRPARKDAKALQARIVRPGLVEMQMP